jgi:hypothetical protein
VRNFEVEIQNLEWGIKNEGLGGCMGEELRRLLVDTIAEMKELKGELREFKLHVMGRVEKLEKKEGERNRERLSVISVFIASAALAVSIIVNFIKGGK